MIETGEHEAPSPLVETSWLSERLDNPDGKTSIINGLSAAEHSGRVIRFPRAGSVNVDCEILVDPNSHTLLPTDKLQTVFESAGALKTNRAITYCGGGVAASLDALALTLLGVPHVAVYHGSMVEWTADPRCRWRQTDRRLSISTLGKGNTR